VVAIGTGNKCLSPSKLSPKGDVINDCHAEIVVRRACLRYAFPPFPWPCKISGLVLISRYLWGELQKHLKGNAEESIFLSQEKEAGPFPLKLKPGITFHLYISHAPCTFAQQCLPRPHTQTLFHFRWRWFNF